MKLFSSPHSVRLPMTFASPAEGISLVKENEADFDARLNAAAEAICADCVSHGVKVIRLSGPSCAGKTTTAHKLTSVLEAAGRVVYPISIDDFFYGRDVLEAMADASPDGELDYDSVAAIDLPALAECVRDLMEKGSARIPVFDFVTGYTTEYRDLTVPEGVEPIFLFEGIQAVYPEVAALFVGVPERSIFINVMKETVLVSSDGTERVYTPEDIRLMRRLVRDEAKRELLPISPSPSGTASAPTRRSPFTPTPIPATTALTPTWPSTCICWHPVCAASWRSIPVTGMRWRPPAAFSPP